MCGRFVQALSPADYAEVLGLPVSGAADAASAPCFNVAPTLPVLALRTDDVNGYRWVRLRWGLVPHWSDGPDRRYSMINARAETLDQRAAFREPFQSRRCLIPADGFYEWRIECSGRQPYLIHRRDGAPLFLAGLWEHWHRGDRVIDSCTIVVTDANPVVAPIHDRMPAVIAPESATRWLAAGTPASELKQLLRPWPADLTEAYPVSTRVNSPRNDGPDLIEPAPPTDPAHL